MVQIVFWFRCLCRPLTVPPDAAASLYHSTARPWSKRTICCLSEVIPSAEICSLLLDSRLGYITSYHKTIDFLVVFFVFRLIDKTFQKDNDNIFRSTYTHARTHAYTLRSYRWDISICKQCHFQSAVGCHVFTKRDTPLVMPDNQNYEQFSGRLRFLFTWFALQVL